MRLKIAIAFALTSSTLLAQIPAAEAGGMSSASALKRTPYYVDPMLLDL
jgi:hypothetical protein